MFSPNFIRAVIIGLFGPLIRSSYVPGPSPGQAAKRRTAKTAWPPTVLFLTFLLNSLQYIELFMKGNTTLCRLGRAQRNPTILGHHPNRDHENRRFRSLNRKTPNHPVKCRSVETLQTWPFFKPGNRIRSRGGA